MKTHTWQQVLGILAVAAALVGLPGLGMAAVADQDGDGIDDSVETSGSGISLNGVFFPPCSTTSPPAPGTAARNACISPTSKDIFVYLVLVAADGSFPPNGGFLGTNRLINTATTPVDVCGPNPTTGLCTTGLFAYVTAPNKATTRGKVDGLGVGIHVAVVGAAPASRAVGGNLGQQAVVMTVDESPSAPVFGRTDEGTPSNTGNSTIFPVFEKNYLLTYVFGGVDSSTVESTYILPYIQRTASHELSHAAALTAMKDSNLGYHYSTSSGVVMASDVACTTNKGGSCVIYNDYATGDIPCLLALVSPTTNPLQCKSLP